jgi:hypothetical protein
MILAPAARRTGLLLAAGALLASAGLPSAASAAELNCDASAFRGTVLTAPPIEPVTANRNQATCKAVTAGLSTAALPLPLSAAAVAAQTVVGTPTGPGQRAGAFGGIADVSVRALPELPIALPTGSIPPVPPVTVTLVPAVPAVVVGGVTITQAVPATTATVDVQAALRALLPNGKLPTADLLRLTGAGAFAEAKCVNGATQLTGSSQVAGLSVFGRSVPTDRVVDESLSLIDTAAIDPSKALDDLSQFVTVTGPASGGAATVNAAVLAAVKPIVATLPKITIPATLARVKVTPSSQVRSGNKLTQQALRVEVSIAGQNVADLVLGEASVTGAGLECAAAAAAAAAAPTATQLALQCTKRRLVLTDVLRRGNRVRLVGAADKRFVGRRVGIVFSATGRRVATALVRSNGSFSTTAPLPPRSIRSTNRARYLAKIGTEKSLDLKLERRMFVSAVRARNGRLTINGHVTRPLGSPAQTITLTRRVSCKKTVVMKRFKPTRTGSFRVNVAAPPKQQAAVYRLGTRVRKTTRNPKLFPTFTLPRAVTLK